MLFGSTGSGGKLAVTSGYVSKGFSKDPKHVTGGDLLNPPLIEINASESSRIPFWPFAEGEPTIQSEREAIEARRLNTVLRMVRDLNLSLVDSLNKFTIRLLTWAIEQERNHLEWDLAQKEILKRLDLGWSFLRPNSTDYMGLAFEMDRLFPKCSNSPYLEGSTAFLCGPPGELGIWRRPATEITIVAWADGRELTFGLTAYLLCGQAILNASLIYGVELGEMPELDPHSLPVRLRNALH
jgi:hypothetical protein